MTRIAAIVAMALCGWTGAALAQDESCLETMHELRAGPGLLGGPAGLSARVEAALSDFETGYLSAAMLNVRLLGTPEFSVAPDFRRCLVVTGQRLSYARTPESDPILEVPLRLVALAKEPMRAEAVARLKTSAVRFFPPTTVAGKLAPHPAIRVALPQNAAGVRPNAGSGVFVTESRARFYRMAARDPQDLAAGITVLLCIDDCKDALASLPALPAETPPVVTAQAPADVAPAVEEEAPAPPPADPSPDTVQAPETLPAPDPDTSPDSAPTPESEAAPSPDVEEAPSPEAEAPPATDADAADAPEADAAAEVQPEPIPDTPAHASEATADPVAEALAPNAPQDQPAPAPEALERDKFWAGRFADLASPVFLLEGTRIDPPDYTLSCALDMPFDVATVEEVLLRLYGPGCLDASAAGLEAVSASVIPATTFTERLGIEIALERLKKPEMGNLTVTHDAAPDLYRFCALTARFSEIVDGMTLDDVRFTGAPVPFFNGRVETGYALPRGSIPVPENARWRNLAVQIVAPPEAENQTCRLEAPVQLALRDEADPRIAVDLDGNVTLSELGLQPNKQMVHVFLNTYLGGTLVGTAEQDSGAYAFADRQRLLQYATAYADYVVSGTPVGGRPVTYVFHAPDATGVLREIMRLSPVDREAKPDWLSDLATLLQTEAVNAGYADARVIAQLDALRAEGAIVDGAELHVFGRAGFNDPAAYCSAQAFRPYDDSDLRIVDFASLAAFPGLDADLGLQNAVAAPIRTLHCTGGLPHHIVIFPDSRTLSPTDAELFQSFDGLTSPRPEGD